MKKLLQKHKLTQFLKALGTEYDVFVPVKKNEQRFYKKYSSLTEDETMVIGEVRAFEPLKAFFSLAREVVAEGYKNECPRSNERPYAIIGVKACDLKGFKVQDNVFKEGDFKDPFYIRKREGNLIVSADCTCAINTCFCLALNVQPAPQEDFDLNLSEVAEGYVVTVGSKKGRAVVDKHPALFNDVTERMETEVEQNKKSAIEQVEKNIADNEVPHQDSLKGMIEKKYESDVWEDEAKTCVECGACNTICPTCHCFLLYDQKNEKNMERLRIWDSCMIKDFARVAGGANPRGRLWMRLRNRFEKKFDFFPKIAGTYACTGCGRCISACPAKIDIRKVLKRVAS